MQKLALVVALGALLSVTVLAAACAKTLDGDDGDGDGAGGGKPGGCSGYLDEAGATVTIRWENNRAEDIFVWGPPTVCNAGRPDFSLVLNGGEVSIDRTGCNNTCQELQGPYASCNEGCDDEPLVRVAPGATYEFEWASIEYVLKNDMPGGCYHETQDLNPCFRQTPLPEATYSVRGAYFIFQQCEDSLGMPCTCSGSVCEVPPGFSITGSNEIVSATAALPSGGVVTLSVL